MARRALMVQSKEGAHISKDERERRARAEAYLKRGSIDDYEPATLDAEGMEAYRRIVAAMPENTLAEVDGFTVETVADALSNMSKLRAEIDAHGLIVTKETKNGTVEVPNPAVAMYAKYSDIAKRWMIELGCTPSARAKIAQEAATKKARPKSATEIWNEDDEHLSARELYEGAL